MLSVSRCFALSGLRPTCKGLVLVLDYLNGSSQSTHFSHLYLHFSLSYADSSRLFIHNVFKGHFIHPSLSWTHQNLRVFRSSSQLYIPLGSHDPYPAYSFILYVVTTTSYSSMKFHSLFSFHIFQYSGFPLFGS